MSSGYGARPTAVRRRRRSAGHAQRSRCALAVWGVPGAPGIAAARGSDGIRGPRCRMWLGAQAWPMRPFRGFRSAWPIARRRTLRCIASRSTLAGFTRLAEFLSGRRSGSLVRRSLLVVRATSRFFAVRPARTQASERLPQAWAALSGYEPRRRPGTEVPGSPRGVRRPFSDIGDRVRSTRACLTRHVPPAEFLTPSAVCSSATLRSREPLPLMGFLVRSDLPAWFATCYQAANTSRSLRPGLVL